MRRNEPREIEFGYGARATSDIYHLARLKPSCFATWSMSGGDNRMEYLFKVAFFFFYFLINGHKRVSVNAMPLGGANSCRLHSLEKLVLNAFASQRWSSVAKQIVEGSLGRTATWAREEVGEYRAKVPWMQFASHGAPMRYLLRNNLGSGHRGTVRIRHCQNAAIPHPATIRSWEIFAFSRPFYVSTASSLLESALLGPETFSWSTNEFVSWHPGSYSSPTNSGPCGSCPRLLSEYNFQTY